MAILSTPDRERIRSMLAALESPVRLITFTQTFGCEACFDAKRILDDIADLSDRISIVEHNLVLDTDAASRYGIDRAPGLAVVGVNPDGTEWDPGIRFFGATAGTEIVALVDAIRLVAHRDSGLSPASRALAAQVMSPLHIHVFSTPTCPHCPRAIALAHRLAVESPHITAVAVDATEYPDLVRQYRVNGVPKTVADTAEILGALPEDQFVPQVLAARLAPPPA